jgi:hypothetical protein
MRRLSRRSAAKPREVGPQFLRTRLDCMRGTSAYFEIDSEGLPQNSSEFSLARMVPLRTRCKALALDLSMSFEATAIPRDTT